ncbi:unnamed protein product [Timema podura]|uniref:Uncharacterized protein n=1 Tax=Timema podura TaxID=61482 RepID=A0ABN7NID2_TIMPD|nr:unnamed protein product [Timema podura]
MVIWLNRSSMAGMESCSICNWVAMFLSDVAISPGCFLAYAARGTWLASRERYPKSGLESSSVLLARIVNLERASLSNFTGVLVGCVLSRSDIEMIEYGSEGGSDGCSRVYGVPPFSVGVGFFSCMDNTKLFLDMKLLMDPSRSPTNVMQAQTSSRTSTSYPDLIQHHVDGDGMPHYLKSNYHPISPTVSGNNSCYHPHQQYQQQPLRRSFGHPGSIQATMRDSYINHHSTTNHNEMQWTSSYYGNTSTSQVSQHYFNVQLKGLYFWVLKGGLHNSHRRVEYYIFVEFCKVLILTLVKSWVGIPPMSNHVVGNKQLVDVSIKPTLKLLAGYGLDVKVAQCTLTWTENCDARVLTILA